MSKPPRLAGLLLKLTLPYRDKEYLYGDYEFIYNDLVERQGKLKADFWYWGHVLKTVPGYLTDKIYWGGMMFKNYLKTAFRNFAKKKAQTTINLMGLAIGIAAVVFILLWVNDELSYDKFNEKAERTYRITQRFDNEGQIIHQTQTPSCLAGTIKELCPEVEEAARLSSLGRGTIVKVGDKQINETKHGMADEHFFDVFSVKLIKGDPKTALLEPYTVVLSETAAQKYFGNKDPMGKTLTIYSDDYVVTGLYQDIPANSHFHFDLLLSVNTDPFYKEEHWGWNMFKTYVVLREGADTKLLEEKLNEIIRTRIHRSEEEYQKRIQTGHFITMPLQKLADIHLNSHLLWEFEANGNESYVQFLSIIAIFILFIAIVNYVNLSTANASTRAREIGIRKSVGSTRNAIIRQFITESVLISFLAFLVSVVIVYLFMPMFRDVVGKPWLNLSAFDHPIILISVVGIAIFVGLLSGIYPSFVLSSFEPVSIMRNNYGAGKRKSFFRNTLVVIQFALSIILLVGTFVVNEQMKFTQNKNLGFNKEQVLVINTFGKLGEKVDVFKNELKKNPAILGVSTSTSVPGYPFYNLGSNPEGKDGGQPTNIFGVDDEFKNVFKVEMVKGRFFSREMASDSQAVVISETLAREYGIDDPLDKRMLISIKGFSPFNIIGVMKDFHYESFHEKIKPLELVMIPGYGQWGESYVSVKLSTANINETIKTIARTWQKLIPEAPFEYSFMDNIYADLYRNEERTSNVFGVFTFLALFVSCLGLIGLTSFVTRTRTKEIGVRKVLGSSVSGLVIKLSAEFTRWVMLANLIAWPLAYFVMNNWLEDFAYRINIQWWMFVISGLVALVISLLTVSVQSLKAAHTSPVEALKCE